MLINAETLFTPANLGLLDGANKDALLKQIAEAIIQEDRKNPLYSYPMTEAEQATFIAKALGGNILRYSPGKGRLVYDPNNGTWTTEKAEVAWQEAARAAAKKRADMSMVNKDQQERAFAFYRQMESRRGIQAVLQILENDPKVYTLDNDFDKDIWLLNACGEAYDLRTGEHRPTKPGDLFTRTTGVKPEQGDIAIFEIGRAHV